MRTASPSWPSLGVVVLFACAAPPPEPATAAAVPAVAPARAAPAPPAAASVPTVAVTLEAKSGSTLTGSATFTSENGGVRVHVAVAGLSPGKHGVHVHEKGDCSAADGASAGGHFNPGGHPHGLPTGSARHLGDLGNVEVAADGTGTLDLAMPGATLEPGAASSYLGRAIVVHEKTDDGGQPTGNAGGRIGCGVITGG